MSSQGGIGTCAGSVSILVVLAFFAGASVVLAGIPEVAWRSLQPGLDYAVFGRLENEQWPIPNVLGVARR